MMGIVEMLPEWLLLLPFAVQPVCLTADDELHSHHYPFASTMSGVPCDLLRALEAIRQGKNLFFTLARATSQGV